MNRYNELKLQVLSLFASTQGEWLGPNEAAERLNFSPARSAWTYFKRLWSFGLLERRPEVEEPWNTASAISGGRGFGGYVRRIEDYHAHCPVIRLPFVIPWQRHYAYAVPTRIALSGRCSQRSRPWSAPELIHYGTA